MCVIPSYIQAAIMSMDSDTRHSSLSRLQHVLEVIKTFYLAPIQENITSAFKGDLTLAYLARYSRLNRLVEVLTTLVEFDDDLLTQFGEGSEAVQSHSDLRNYRGKLEMVLHESARLQHETWHVDNLPKENKKQTEANNNDLFELTKYTNYFHEHYDLGEKKDIFQDKKSEEKINRGESPLSDFDFDTKICCLQDSTEEILTATKQLCERAHSRDISKLLFSKLRQFEGFESCLPLRINPIPPRPAKGTVWITSQSKKCWSEKEGIFYQSV